MPRYNIGMKKVKAEKVLIFFEDYHHDGGDKVVEATEAEWQSLIAPAMAEAARPIDAATVDEVVFDKLYGRKDLDLKKSEIEKITRVVPLV